MTLRVLDLFSGIGGFSLGLERTGGFRTVAFCEIEPFCQRVLAKHWPGVPIYDDIRTLTATRLAADGIGVDVICGGFPCQDISHAGKGAGITGERGGLWRDYARLVGELRPRYVIVENVSALLGRGIGDVLGDLAEIGYDAEWHCIPASAVGAPHRRDRVWIVAHANATRFQERNDVLANTQQTGDTFQRRSSFGVHCAPIFADPKCREQSLGWTIRRMGWLDKSVSWNRDWPLTAEPVLGRGTDGVPNRLDRLRALGNAVVPQIPELIGRAILQTESASKIPADTRADPALNSADAQNAIARRAAPVLKVRGHSS